MSDVTWRAILLGFTLGTLACFVVDQFLGVPLIHVAATEERDDG